ncbi:MAG: hypothetical protein IIT33_02125 [Prevotella sp.]|nr:hypothetical protein [Prevotella sp.]
MDDDIVYTPDSTPDETPTIRELIDHVTHMDDKMGTTAAAINRLAEQASNPVHQKQEARINAEAEQNASTDTAVRRPMSETPLRDLPVYRFEGMLHDAANRLGRYLHNVDTEAETLTVGKPSAKPVEEPTGGNIKGLLGTVAGETAKKPVEEPVIESVEEGTTEALSSAATEAVEKRVEKLVKPSATETVATAVKPAVTTAIANTAANVAESYKEKVEEHRATTTSYSAGMTEGRTLLNEGLEGLAGTVDKTKTMLEKHGFDDSFIDRLVGGLFSSSVLDALGGTAAIAGGVGEIVRAGRDMTNTARNLNENGVQVAAQNTQDAALDITHLLGFTAYSGKQLKDWREVEANDYGLRLDSDEARNVTKGRETLAQMGLSSDAIAVKLSDQLALSGENVAKTFDQLSTEARRLNIGFQSLTNNVSDEVTAANQTLGSQDDQQIIKGSAAILGGMRDAGLETTSGSLGKFLQTPAFSNAYVMMMGGLQGKARQNAEYALMGGTQEMALFVEDEGLWPRIAQEMGRYASQTETAMAGGTTNEWANAAYLSTTGLSQLVDSNAQETQDWLHGEAQGRNMSVKVTLSQGLKGEVVDSGVVERGEYGDGSSWLEVKNPELRNR